MDGPGVRILRKCFSYYIAKYIFESRIDAFVVLLFALGSSYKPTDISIDYNLDCNTYNFFY